MPCGVVRLSTTHQGTQEYSSPPVHPKVVRQTLGRAVETESQRVYLLAQNHRMNDLQVKFGPMSAAAKSSVFSHHDTDSQTKYNWQPGPFQSDTAK